MNDLENEIKNISDALIKELIELTPEFMKEIQFEIISTDDGGADIGLIEISEEVKQVSLSDFIYSAVSEYLPRIKKYISGWKRTHIILNEENGKWNVEINYENA